jgi:hypothetical protein
LTLTQEGRSVDLAKAFHHYRQVDEAIPGLERAQFMCGFILMYHSEVVTEPLMRPTPEGTPEDSDYQDEKTDVGIISFPFLIPRLNHLI